MPVSYEPIRHVRSVQEGWPLMATPPEGAGKTFKDGVPIVLASGLAQEAAFGAAEIVYGVSVAGGSNLAVAGVGQELSIGTAPNMPLSKIIPVGAPIVSGGLKVYCANASNLFSIMMLAGQVFAVTDIGVAYGLTKDGTSGYWYLDKTDTSGDNVVAVVRGLDPSSPNSVADGARVYFNFLAALRAF